MGRCPLFKKLNMKIGVFYHETSTNGPAKVANNLVRGLIEISAEFSVNTFSDFDIVLQNCDRLNHDLSNCFIGPNICTLPIDSSRVMNYESYKKIIVPCDWVKQLYMKWLPENKLFVWAVGIDTDLFYDMSKEQKEIDCLIYFKRRDESELNSVIDFLTQKEQTYKIIRYGSYSEQDFIDTLKISRYGIVIDKCESQGIAIEEMMAINLPLLVWDTPIWSDRGSEYSVPATSVPYWDETCGVKFYNISELENAFNFFIKNKETFTPRRYVQENLDMAISAKKIIDAIKL